MVTGKENFLADALPDGEQVTWSWCRHDVAYSDMEIYHVSGQNFVMILPETVSKFCVRSGVYTLDGLFLSETLKTAHRATQRPETHSDKLTDRKTGRQGRRSFYNIGIWISSTHRRTDTQNRKKIMDQWTRHRKKAV